MLNFVHPGFLLAGAIAASLPILIHLLLRQRARIVHIGSVRFLKSVILQHTRRRRIRQWLLLAMRVFAILLLALLFARPFLDSSAIVGLDREVAVLIDRSASMQVRTGDGDTIFAKALREAKRELSRLEDNTTVHLALFDAGGSTVVNTADVDEDLQPFDAATDYGLALAWAHDVMTVSRRPDRKVVMIADLQRSGLNRTEFRGFPAGVDLVIHDVGRTMTQNVCVVDARALVTEIRPKDPVRVNVRLKNAGAMSLRDLEVTLQLQGPQGKIVRRQEVTLAGGALKTVEFPLEELQTDGVYSGQVSVDHTDDLACDNRRWLAFEARHPDRVLLVDGQEGRSVYANETYYLETTLRLRAPAGETPTRSFEVERIVWEDGEGFPGLEGFRATVMANVRRLSDVDIRRLREYVESGGNLLFFFGDQTKPDLMTRMKDAGLFPGSIVRSPTIGPWRIDAWDEQHPLLFPFRDPQQGDLRRLRFEKLIEVNDLDPSARVLLSSANEPILVEQALGDGTMLYCTTAADRAWSDWPQSRLYVPLVRQMMAYLTEQSTGRNAVTDRVIARRGEKAGITQQQGRTVVRNLDPLETQLDRVSEEEFREAYGLADRGEAAVLADLTASIKPPPGAERPNESWDIVIWVLFALLTVEILFASRVHA